MPSAHIAEISVRLEISGGDLGDKPVEFPCMSMLVRFLLNGIPEASFSIAVGFKGRDPTTLSPIHEHANKLGETLSIQAYFTARGSYGPKYNWPDVEVLLFDGYVTGVVSMTNASGGQIVTLSASHWLVDLHNSSVLTNILHPTASQDLLNQAGVYLPTTGVIGGETPLSAASSVHYLGTTIFQDYSGRISDDLWGEVIKRGCRQFAQTDTWNTAYNLLYQGSRGQVLPQTVLKNDAATSALDRMDNENHIKVEPLTLTGLPQMTRDKIAYTISSIFSQLRYGKTFWEKILACAQAFSFSIVPTAQTATCAPIIPLLKDSWMGIFPDEYSQFKSSTGMPIIYRGRIAMGPGLSARDNTHRPDYGMDIYDLVAEGLTEFKHGIFILSQLPAWISASLSPGECTDKLLRSSANPIVPNIKSPAAAEYETEREARHAYNKAMFLYEIFKTRNGSIRGKLRFDIAPGSSVCVVGSGASDPTEGLTYFYGLVTMVEIQLDANNVGNCGTTISLSSIHTLKEHQTDQLTLGVHPLYNKAWTGSPLVNIPGLPGEL